MRNFTQDERNLMMLYSTGTLLGLCAALKQVKEQLAEDEEELCTLVDTVLSKLSDMDEDAFDRLNFYLDF